MNRGVFEMIVAALLWTVLLLAVYGYFAGGFKWPPLR
jgi:hypothetical protein